MKSLLVEDNPADVRLIREMLKDPAVGNLQLQHVDRLDSALATPRLSAGLAIRASATTPTPEL